MNETIECPTCGDALVRRSAPGLGWRKVRPGGGGEPHGSLSCACIGGEMEDIAEVEAEAEKEPEPVDDDGMSAVLNMIAGLGHRLRVAEAKGASLRGEFDATRDSYARRREDVLSAAASLHLESRNARNGKIVPGPGEEDPGSPVPPVGRDLGMAIKEKAAWLEHRLRAARDTGKDTATPDRPRFMFHTFGTGNGKRRVDAWSETEQGWLVVAYIHRRTGGADGWRMDSLFGIAANQCGFDGAAGLEKELEAALGDMGGTS